MLQRSKYLGVEQIHPSEARAAMVKHGRYSGIERAVRHAEREHRVLLADLAASARHRFWRNFFARAAILAITADDRRRIRQALIDSRTASLRELSQLTVANGGASRG